MNKQYQKILESSLSRLWSHNEQHDCGAITAFRNYSDCDGSQGRIYTKAENLQRNKSLKAKLLTSGYDVTPIRGRYPEGGESKEEQGFFVVDSYDKGHLERDLRLLGEEFNQDSILFIPQGAISNQATAYLIGTNHCENNWLGYGKKNVFSKGKIGYESPIYTSYINGRPFIFESIGNKISLPGSGYGNWVLNEVAQKHWSEIEIDV